MKDRKKWIIGILIIILMFFLLSRCNDEKKENKTDDIPTIEELLEEVVDQNLVFYTYEEVYTYYSMLEENKKALKDEITELFLASDPQQINQQGYARYYGNLGRKLFLECERFKRVVYAGGGDKELPLHVYNYQYFYTNNEDYHKISLCLLDIEKQLNQNHHAKVLEQLKNIHNELLKMGDNENESHE